MAIAIDMKAAKTMIQLEIRIMIPALDGMTRTQEIAETTILRTFSLSTFAVYAKATLEFQLRRSQSLSQKLLSQTPQAKMMAAPCGNLSTMIILKNAHNIIPITSIHTKHAVLVEEEYTLKLRKMTLISNALSE